MNEVNDADAGQSIEDEVHCQRGRQKAEDLLGDEHRVWLQAVIDGQIGNGEREDRDLHRVLLPERVLTF